jgi:hypothetical protein
MSTYQRSVEEGARDPARANVVLLNVRDLGDFIRTIQGPGRFRDGSPWAPWAKASGQVLVDEVRR